MNAVYDTEETKSTGLANRLLAEKVSAASGRLLVERARSHDRPEVSWRPRAVPLAERQRDPRGFSGSGTFLTGFSARLRVIAYNTKTVTSEHAPRSVFDPGRPTVGRSDGNRRSAFRVDSPFTLRLCAPSRAMKRWTTSSDGSKLIASELSTAIRRCRSGCAGEVKVGLTDTDDVNVAIEKGDLLAWYYPTVRVWGVPVMPNMVSLDCQRATRRRRSKAGSTT